MVNVLPIFGENLDLPKIKTDSVSSVDRHWVFFLSKINSKMANSNFFYKVGKSFFRFTCFNISISECKLNTPTGN